MRGLGIPDPQRNEEPNLSAKNSRGSTKAPALASWPIFFWASGQSGRQLVVSNFFFPQGLLCWRHFEAEPAELLRSCQRRHSRMIPPHVWRPFLFVDRRRRPSSPMAKQRAGAELGAGRCLMLVDASVRACDTSRVFHSASSASDS